MKLTEFLTLFFVCFLLLWNITKFILKGYHKNHKKIYTLVNLNNGYDELHNFIYQ